MTNYTQHPIGKRIPSMSKEEFLSLKANINNSGYQKDKPVILFEGMVLDGWHRYTACKELRIEPEYIQFIDIDGYTGPLQYVWSNNGVRRHFTTSQKAALAVNFMPDLEKEAKDRKLSTLNKGEARCGKITTTGENGKSRDKVAEIFDVGASSVQKAKKIQKENPEEFEKLITGEKTIEDVIKENKIEKRKQQIDITIKKIETENKTITGLFDVVVIDPPWDYTEKGGFGVDSHDPDSNRGGVDYSTMQLDKIGDITLPVKEDSVLFLWTTHAFLRDSFDLLDKWGFEYKATIVWDKDKMGIGRTIRMQCEFCLLAVKGKPIIQGSSQRDIIRESRREHSRKPEAFYKMVEDITMGSRLDYFARQQRKGWIVYGAETTKF